MPKRSSTLFNKAALDIYDQKKDHDVSSSKKTKDQPASSKGTIPSKSLKTDKTVQAEETIKDPDQEGVMVEKPMVDEVVNDDDHSQDDITPCQDKSKWFKQSPRPEIPYPKWHKEPNEDDAPEQPWFNELGEHKNYIELEYNFEQWYLALTDQLDWQNPKGDKIPQDFSKPLPLLDALGRLYILVDLFFNKDLEYLRSRNLEEKKYATSFTKPKAARYELYRIKEMIPKLWSSSKKKKRKDHDVSSSKKTKDQPASSKGTIPSKSSKTDKTVQAEETIKDLDQEGVMDEKPTVDEVGEHKNYIELEYNFEQWYLALTDQLDWQNPKGDKIPQDFSKPLPLLDALGRLYILVDLFFNKDLEYLRSRNLEEKKYATSFTKPKAARPQVLALGINSKELYTVFYKPRGAVSKSGNGKKCLMREDEVYKFGDATIMKVCDELKYWLKNFKLGYNVDMPTRPWSDKDQR
nr:hypothetical protein [Tanacetum cinerariifolium]